MWCQAAGCRYPATSLRFALNRATTVRLVYTHPRSRPLHTSRDHHTPRAPWREPRSDRRALARPPVPHRPRTDPRPDPTRPSLEDRQDDPSNRPPHQSAAEIAPPTTPAQIKGRVRRSVPSETSATLSFRHSRLTARRRHQKHWRPPSNAGNPDRRGCFLGRADSPAPRSAYAWGGSEASPRGPASGEDRVRAGERLVANVLTGMRRLG